MFMLRKQKNVGKNSRDDKKTNKVLETQIKNQNTKKVECPESKDLQKSSDNTSNSKTNNASKIEGKSNIENRKKNTCRFYL